MKKLLIISLIIFGCKKEKTPEPTSIAYVAPIVTATSHYIEVDATSSIATFALITVNWNYSKSIDSVYTNSGSSLHFVKGYTLQSDSILVYSGMYDHIIVRVDGMIKDNWTGTGVVHKIKVN